MLIKLFIYLVVYLLLTTFFSDLLESSMILHMLVQLPLLAALGFFCSLELSKLYTSLIRYADDYGAVTFVFVTGVFMFWMIPSALDQSVTEWSYKISKYISVFFMGFVYGYGRLYMNPILHGVLKFEGWAMLCRFGYGYMVAPQRLCSNYLIEEQIVLGKIFLVLAAIIALYWSAVIFFGGGNAREKHV